MSAELDMSQYLDLFLQEGREQLEILERETLHLEKDPTEERLQIIFRAAHTLKGSSRAMGFARFAELTHEMENILDQLRHNTLQSSPEIADALLATVDALAQMVDTIEQGKGDDVECGQLVARLQAVGGTAREPDAPKLISVECSSVGFPTHIFDGHLELLSDVKKSTPVYHAQFRLRTDCVMKYVRAFMAMNLVQENGEILLSNPEAEGLEEEKFETDFEFVFTYKGNVSELEQGLRGITEIDQLWFKEWQRGEESTTSVPLRIEQGTAQPTVTPSTAPTQKADGAAASGQTVRVDVARLDSLMNLVGELVIDRTRISQIANELGQKSREPNVDALQETVSHIARITNDLQDQIMKARMMPIETVFNRFPRVVRDLTHKLGKKVDLEILGGETELDRSVIEVIGDPILHMLRNSIDHGIESPEAREAAGKPATGKVKLIARHYENHIVIEIEDDGRGIDTNRLRAKAVSGGLLTEDQASKLTEREAINLLFQSGLSTAIEISEVSGRGVGMDIVRSNIVRLGGLIDIETTLGVGSKFSLRLPLTLAIIRGLLVGVESQVFVLPLGSVLETLNLEKSMIKKANRREVIVLRGQTVPLVRLMKFYGIASKSSVNSKSFAVIVGLGTEKIGLVVDNLIGEQEVVIKSLSRLCGETKGISGSTILGDGNVALISDINSVVESANNK